MKQHPVYGQALDVAKALRSAGYVVYFAGGCVRDGLLGRPPKDLDLATSATPDQVLALFPRALGIGKAFGIMMLPLTPGHQLEIATFREDGEYRDGRRPETIRFSSPEEDAKRRDFTVNALFLDPITEEVIDFVNGQADLKQRILRTVGNPETRFQEDQLRLLRAVRFVAQLNFSLEQETWKQVQRLAPFVVRVSQERILEEIKKLLSAEFLGSALNPLAESGLWGVLFLHWFGRQARAFQTREMEEILTLQDSRSRLFWLLRRSGLQASDSLNGLKLSHPWSQALDLWFRWEIALTQPPSLTEMLEFYRSDLTLDFRFWLRSQDQSANAVLLSGRFSGFDGLPQNFDEALVRSADLKPLGVAPGPRMGELLKAALEIQLEIALQQRSLPTKDEILRRLSESHSETIGVHRF